jgi:hypothetical protein
MVGVIVEQSNQQWYRNPSAIVVWVQKQAESGSSKNIFHPSILRIKISEIAVQLFVRLRPYLPVGVVVGIFGSKSSICSVCFVHGKVMIGDFHLSDTTAEQALGSIVVVPVGAMIKVQFWPQQVQKNDYQLRIHTYRERE